MNVTSGRNDIRAKGLETTRVDNTMLIKRRCLKRSLLLVTVCCLVGYFLIWMQTGTTTAEQDVNRNQPRETFEHNDVVDTGSVHKNRQLQNNGVPQPRLATQGGKISKEERTNTSVTHFTGGNGYHGNTSQDHKRRMILSTTNEAYVDFAENWLESIRRLGISPNITIVAEDLSVYSRLLRRTDVHVSQADQLAQSEKLVFDSPKYKAFVNKRPQYILDYLTQGVDVLFTDVDTVLLDDPFQYFNESFDIFVQEDQGPPNKTILCAGFVYYRSTNLTIKFVRRWIERMDFHNNTKPDQMVLNMILRNRLKNFPNLKVKILDPDKFIPGRFYFDEPWRKNNTDRYLHPVMIHNNWIMGHDVKVKRFIQTGLWFLENHVMIT